MRRVSKGNNSSKILKPVIIAFVLVMLFELLLKYIIKKSLNIYVYNVIIETVVLSFIFIHFTIGFNKIYDFIIKNRYKLSFILIIVSTVCGIFRNSASIKEWIFASDIPLSLVWNIKFYALILASYELFFLITNNEKISVVGTIVIAFSGFVQWNFNLVGYIILGELVVLLINKLINENILKNQIILSLLIVLCSIKFFLGDISLVISFEFVFIPLIIWCFLKNKEVIKENKFGLIFSITSIVLSFVIYKIYVTKSTFVINERIIQNEYGTKYLFAYLYNVFLPFKHIKKSNIYGSFFSVFPFPMVIALYYIYKSDKHTEFLFPLSIFSSIGTIFCFVGYPEIVPKFLGFNKISTIDMAVAVNLINVFLIIYMIANIDDRIFKTKYAMRVTLLLCCLVAFANYPPVLSIRRYILIYISELAATGFLFLNFEDKKYKKVLLAFLVILSLLSGVFVNKITKRDIPQKQPLDTYALIRYID